MNDVDASIAAWIETLDSVLGLGERMDETDWARLTECPGWTVKDIFGHLVGGEVWMAQGHPPPIDLHSVANEPVLARRTVDRRTVLDELRAVFALRREQVADGVPNPDAPAVAAYGGLVTVGTLHAFRAFDVWVHEQDIRRAVGRPGNLGTAAARIARGIFLTPLPRAVAKLAAAPAGSVIRIQVDGPVAFDRSVIVDDSGRATWGAAPAGPATVGLHTDWETFARLAAGRIAPAGAPVEVSGDRELAGRILAHLAVTP